MKHWLSAHTSVYLLTYLITLIYCITSHVNNCLHRLVFSCTWNVVKLNVRFLNSLNKTVSWLRKHGMRYFCDIIVTKMVKYVFNGTCKFKGFNIMSYS